MSIMRLKKRMAKYLKWAMYLFAFIFAFGSLFFFGSGSPLRGRTTTGKAAPDSVASVNGTEISRDELNAYLRRQWEQMRMFGGMGLTQIPFLKQQALEQAQERTLQLNAARQEGARVTNKDVTEHLQQLYQQQVMMVKFQQGEKAFRREIREKYGSEESYVNHLVDNTSAAERDAVREQVMLEKLQQVVKDRVKASEKEYRESMVKAKARLILARSQTPPALPGKPPPASASADAAARTKAEDVLKEIRSGADFATVAQQKSDDLLAKAKGGLIEGNVPPKATDKEKEEAQWFKRGEKKWQFGDEFDEVVFNKLKPGDVSDVFKGGQGYYIVKLEDRKEALPDDYNDVDYQCDEKKHEYTWTQSGKVTQCPMCQSSKFEVVGTKPPPPGAPKGTETKEYRCTQPKHTYNWTEKGKETDKCPKCGARQPQIKIVSRRKDNYLRTFEDTKKNEAWTKYMDELKKNAKIEIYDPELKAYKLKNDLFTVTDPKERKKRLLEIVSLCKEALSYRDPFIKPSVLHYQMAQAYKEIGDKKNQEEALQEALKTEESVDLHSELGRLYKEQKKTAKAIEELKKAFELVTPQQNYLYGNLVSEFKQLKREDVAEKVIQSALKRDDSASLRLELAKLYKDQKETDKAVEQLKRASKLVTPEQYFVHNQIADEFKALNQTDLAEKERKLAKPPERPPMPPFNLQ